MQLNRRPIVVPKRSVTGNGDAAIRGRSPIFSLTELTVYDIIRNVVIDNIVIDEKGSGCEAQKSSSEVVSI